MLEVGRRRRNRPAPPKIVYEALTALLGHLRKRLNVLINESLRFSFGS